MYTVLCLNETNEKWVGVKFAHAYCMRKFKHGLLNVLTLLVVNFAMAQEANQETSCYAQAEGVYSYQTEALLHAYERAKVSPKEFEAQRTQLITNRESSLYNCEQKDLADMDKFVEDIQINTVIHQQSASRGIASIDVRQPVSIEPVNTYRRGAYIEVNPAAGASHEQHVSEHDDDIPEYNGERVPIGN